MNSKMDLFKNRIKYAINKMGNATVLAKKTGITRQAIGSYAGGDTDPTREKLILIADAANIYIDWLAAGRGPRDIDQPFSVKEETAQYNGEDNGIKVSNLLTKAAEILESGTIYRQVLVANINALYQAVLSDKSNKETRARLSQLEENLNETRKKNEEIEYKMVLLEKKLLRGLYVEQQEGENSPEAATGTPGA